MDRDILAETAHDLLEALRDQTRETVAMAVIDLERLDGEVIATLPGCHTFNFKAEIGHRFPLHCTGPGKAFLSALPSRQLRKTVAALCFKRYTRHTLTTPAGLLGDLHASRQRGHTLDLEEVVDGLDCVAAPLVMKGVPVAAIWITIPTFRMLKAQYDDFGRAVRQTADKIVQRLEGRDFDPSRHVALVVAQAKAYMQEHLHEAVNMEALARQFHVGYCWFHRCFRKHAGVSPNQYHLNLRLAKAAQMLRCTQLPVKEIAAKLGYPTPDYFSAAFKKKMKQPPQQYRDGAGKPHE